MTLPIADAGSFRDPGGQVFKSEGRIFRAVMPSSAPAYEAVRDSGLLEKLVARGLILESREVSDAPLAERAPAPAYVLEHPAIPFVSYPYEWSFSLHKSAALRHLDLHLAALESGFTLSDATAYNMQFLGARPVFIDHLSLTPYREGDIWLGHRQFCMQFLNPLILWSLLGIQPNHWFRGSLEGIAPEDLAPMLRWRHNLSWTVATHVTAQAALQRRSVKGGKSAGHLRQGRLSLNALKGILTGLRAYIARLGPGTAATVWGDYAQDNSYADAEATAKRRFVGEMVRATRPALLLDFGCNSGDYSFVALESGAQRVVGFDFDHGALEQAYRRSEASGADFLPLWLDAANPSPSQGWAQVERQGLSDRAKADALIALAFIHHIAIGRNVPLDMVLDWLVGMAPVGIVEFPPKNDPMVQTLLAQRDDIFANYTEEAFVASLAGRARIVRSEHLSPGGRLMVWYDRS